MRHASRVLDPLKSEREHDIKDKLTSDSTQDGSNSCRAFSFSATARLETPTKVTGTGTVAATRSAERTRSEIIAGALADQLQSMGGKQIARIVFSPHTAAKQTAEVFRHVLGTRGHLASNCGFEPDERLEPGVPAKDRKAYATLLDGSGWLIVGHQPKLTTLAEWLLGGHLPAKTLPLAGSAQEQLSSSATANGSAGPISRSCWPSRAAAPPLSAVTSMNAPVADIAPPSRTTAVLIAIAQSVRRALANAGSRHDGANCSPRPTSMSCLLYRRNWLRWLCKTKR